LNPKAKNEATILKLVHLVFKRDQKKAIQNLKKLIKIDYLIK
jgi:hypothetical protein